MATQDTRSTNQALLDAFLPGARQGAQIRAPQNKTQDMFNDLIFGRYGEIPSALATLASDTGSLVNLPFALSGVNEGQGFDVLESDALASKRRLAEMGIGDVEGIGGEALAMAAGVASGRPSKGSQKLANSPGMKNAIIGLKEAARKLFGFELPDHTAQKIIQSAPQSEKVGGTIRQARQATNPPQPTLQQFDQLPVVSPQMLDKFGQVIPTAGARQQGARVRQAVGGGVETPSSTVQGTQIGELPGPTGIPRAQGQRVVGTGSPGGKTIIPKIDPLKPLPPPPATAGTAAQSQSAVDDAVRRAMGQDIPAGTSSALPGAGSKVEKSFGRKVAEHAGAGAAFTAGVAGVQGLLSSMADDGSIEPDQLALLQQQITALQDQLIKSQSGGGASTGNELAIPTEGNLTIAGRNGDSPTFDASGGVQFAGQETPASAQAQGMTFEQAMQADEKRRQQNFENTVKLINQLYPQQQPAQSRGQRIASYFEDIPVIGDILGEVGDFFPVDPVEQAQITAAKQGLDPGRGKIAELTLKNAMNQGHSYLDLLTLKNKLRISNAEFNKLLSENAKRFEETKLTRAKTETEKEKKGALRTLSEQRKASTAKTQQGVDLLKDVNLFSTF